MQFSKASWKLLGSLMTGRFTPGVADDFEAAGLGELLPTPVTSSYAEPSPPPQAVRRSAAAVANGTAAVVSARRATADLPLVLM